MGVGLPSAENATPRHKVGEYTEFHPALVLRVQATMLRLNEEQRRVLIDKVPDLANLAAGAMTFGQFLDDAPFSTSVAALGLGIWVFLTGCAIALVKGGRP